MSPISMHLVVTNLEQLMHGCRPQHVFDTQGGSVGCENATWLLRDNAGTIAPRHLEVTVRDGHFCVTDTSGRTHLNGDPQPMGVGRIARLGEGDRIDIGPYRLAVSLNSATTAAHESNELRGDVLDAVPVRHDAGVNSDLDCPSANDVIADGHHVHSLDGWTPGDSTGITGEAVTFGRDDHGARDVADALAALEEGLGIPLGPLDSGATRALLRDIGQTLRAAIEGVAALQDRAPRSGSPVEDNPLRLGLGTTPTVQALFGQQRNPFQLPAMAAMCDGLAQVTRQRHASQRAMDTGVAALLGAFAPQALAQRFERYATGETVRNGEWLWSMYSAYYREVMASHAQGAHRLFRGAFNDALDRLLRPDEDRPA